MKLLSFFILTLVGIPVLFGFYKQSDPIINQSAGGLIYSAGNDSTPNQYPVQKSETEWKQILTPDQYRVLRQKGTEIPCSPEEYDSSLDGIYVCAACGQELYDTRDKYNSNTGWPSFWQPIKEDAIKNITDKSHGMVRTEIVCSRCGGHIGHVFDDGPKPTGLRYCTNNTAMKFIKREDIKKIQP